MGAVFDFLLDLILDWDNIPSYEHLAPDSDRGPLPRAVIDPEDQEIGFQSTPVSVVVTRPLGVVTVHSNKTSFYSQDAEGDRQALLDEQRHFELPPGGDPEYPFHDFNYGP